MKRIITIVMLFVAINAQAQSAEVEMSKGVDAYYKKDYSTAMEWFKKAVAIGFPDAFYNVGILYDYGFGVNKNTPEAVQWYEKAAKLGQVSAMKQLSSLYNTGEGGVEVNHKKSFYWNKKLALLGDTLSTFNIGVMYLNEDGSDAANTVQGLDSAALWFSRGVNAGTKQCKTGLYYTGIGFFDAGLAAYEKEDFTMALKLYTKSAKLGSPEGMTNLGEMYYRGKGTKEDVETAKYWLTKAAGRGFDMAIKNLIEINEKPQKVLMVKIKLPNGTYVEKKWDNSINGFAKYTYPNGDSYEGMFKNGDFDGEGKFKWANGASYVGRFLKGSRDGIGKQYYDDGKIEYDGEWKDDAKQGMGTYYYPGGSKYIGSFANSQQNGKGKMITAHTVYDGEWKNDRENGYGKKTFSNDGSVYSGNYINGELQGSGTIAYANGAIESGNFIDGGPAGKWLFKGTDGTTEERYFKSPGMYSVYKNVEKTGYDAKKANDEYNAWWEKTYGKGGTQNSNSMSQLRQQKEQETFDQRRQKEREESQKRIAERERSWERTTDNFNRKYGRY